MATFNKFNSFLEYLGQGVMDLRAAGDTVKVYLSNAAPSATLDSVKLDLAEITAENGYTAGGDDVVNDWTESAGTVSLAASDVTITATGGTVGPFQYAVLYDDTPAATPTDPLIGWWDYGSAITLQDGESVTIDFTTNALTIA